MEGRVDLGDVDMAMAEAEGCQADDAAVEAVVVRRLAQQHLRQLHQQLRDLACSRCNKR